MSTTENNLSFASRFNPLVIKGIRERLRIKQLIAWGLFALIITSFAYLTAYLEASDSQWVYDDEMEEWIPGKPSPINGARAAFPVLLIAQGFILLFLGTGRVASGTAEEREIGLLDYQRMTPMNPFAKIVGYLFGLPVVIKDLSAVEGAAARHFPPPQKFWLNASVCGTGVRCVQGSSRKNLFKSKIQSQCLKRIFSLLK